MIVFQKGRTSIHETGGGDLSKEALSKLLFWGWRETEIGRHSELSLQAYWEQVRLPLKTQKYSIEYNLNQGREKKRIMKSFNT